MTHAAMKRLAWLLGALVLSALITVLIVKNRCERCADSLSNFTITSRRQLELAQDEVVRRQANVWSNSRFSRFLRQQRVTTAELVAAIHGVRAIYGGDNQEEPSHNFFLGSRIKINVAATAAMIPCTFFEPGCDSDAEEYRLKNVAPRKGLCCDVRFAEQMAPATCSAFLISPARVATARHCMFIGSDEKYFVFDFSEPIFGSAPTKFIHGVNLFKAKFPINMSCPQTDDDWAIVTLDGTLSRAPVTFGDGHPAINVPVYSVGYPHGHPVKYVPGASVRTNDKPQFFVVNLDGFKGSSGSPVFDARSDKVEGIWVRGEQTLIEFPCAAEKKCYLPLVCPPDGGRGEDVSRISLLQGGSAPDCAKPVEPNPEPGPAEGVVCDGRSLNEVIADLH
jgi:hypothetical protein